MKLLLSESEAVSAFWFLLKLMGGPGRAKLRAQMIKSGGGILDGERKLLVLAIDQFNADLAAMERQQIVVRGRDVN